MNAIPAANRIVTASDNFPPPKTAIELAQDAIADLAEWASENPTVSNIEQAKAAETQIKRGKEAIRELETERTAKVKPLNEEVKSINGTYKAATTPLEKAIDAIDKPRKDWLRAEEDRRQREAQEAARKAAEAERVAREADAKARQAIEDAKVGVAETNHVALDIDADARFAEFEKASRFAARTDRDSHVKGLRTTEVLTITNMVAAVTAMAGDEVLAEAVLTAARRHRKEWNELPPGIKSETVRT